MPASFIAYVTATTFLQVLLAIGCVTTPGRKTTLDRVVFVLWAGLAAWGVAVLWSAP